MGVLRPLIDKLKNEKRLTHEEYIELLISRNPEDTEYLRSAAAAVLAETYGNRVFTRGLIEFTNICRNDCLYCGIRRSNKKVHRYRLSDEDILSCCRYGYSLGLRTFVLQGGEAPFCDEPAFCSLIGRIHREFPDCAITLSVGERDEATYRAYYEAGARRYLLRHETASPHHYSMLHPPGLTAENRRQCLDALSRTGFQVGAGFMVGSPYQTVEELAADFEFLEELRPEMIGIGPFIHHSDTPFCDMPDGSAELTLYCISILRLMFPKGLIPATTALGTLLPFGREEGIRRGANVIMLGISPENVSRHYMLYEGKLSSSDENLEYMKALRERLHAAGFSMPSERGDHADRIATDSPAKATVRL